MITINSNSREECRHCPSYIALVDANPSQSHLGGFNGGDHYHARNENKRKLALQHCGSCGSCSHSAAVRGLSSSLDQHAGPLSLDGCIFSSSAGIIAAAVARSGGDGSAGVLDSAPPNGRLATGRPARMGIVASVPRKKPLTAKHQGLAACEVHQETKAKDKACSAIFITAIRCFF